MVLLCLCNSLQEARKPPIHACLSLALSYVAGSSEKLVKIKATVKRAEPGVATVFLRVQESRRTL